MTLDQLCEVYQTAAFALPDKGGLRAVVAALRDELCERGQHFAWDAYDTSDWFDDILGDAGEKAAGDRTRESAASGLGSGQAPAANLCEDCPRVGHSTDKTRCTTCPRRSADPSPAVCEWRQTFEGFVSSCPPRLGYDPLIRKPKGRCEKCGKPIVFKEAK